ncbi:hypothetical protein [Nitratiruptor tergarcus]|uniref:Uncharacterized protein n=1 Tax=Nitratiruptor tergarcus DSM 16512 TaxID=1069081 RepID=A0A1W1WPL6_9BACT|nr:hypothetical protein [Nitratiruptor tergarcus]SMC08264.1 hypothetical protein SAMN05660197_0011 [Nitratiruptor tergarcus DSM 16512]
MKKLLLFIASTILSLACSIDTNYLDCLTKHITKSDGFAVNGFFYLYDFNKNGQIERNDWIYYSNDSKKSYRLLGVQPTSDNAFGWQQLASLPQDMDELPTGFFIYLGFYGDESTAFSWIYVPNRSEPFEVYKLMGTTPTGSFVYFDLDCDGYPNPLPDIGLQAFQKPHVPLPGEETGQNGYKMIFNYTGQYQLNCDPTVFGSSSSSSSSSSPIIGKASVRIKSNMQGSVSLPDGAKIFVPTGAVPLEENGSIGEMIFTIEKKNLSTPYSSGGIRMENHIYELGPEGFIFSNPVKITLPILPGTDPNKIVGIATKDQQTGKWHVIPSNVDKAARIVTASILHFSPYGLASFEAGTDSGAWERWKQQHGGYIYVSGGTDTYAPNPFMSIGGNPGLPVKAEYGVCTDGYTISDTEAYNNWFQFTNDYNVIAESTADNHRNDPQKAFLPSGSYNLIEFVCRSEYNNRDPLYLPKYDTYWRRISPTPTIISPGTALYFVRTDDLNDGSWTKGTPPCWGEPTAATGTGKLQITLTWHVKADIDLYVTDPNGKTIYWYNTIVPSGGKLDRDNQCGNFEMGKPENIYWENTPPNGTYKVAVEYYDYCGQEVHNVAYTVRIVKNGQLLGTYTGTLSSEGDRKDVTTFTYP